MKAVLAALLVASLVLVIGCTNDDNTVNPIDKEHPVYPVFHLKLDNGYRTFGVDSVQLTVAPSIGWTGPVYSDDNGFIGTLADGTFIDRIETVTEDGVTYEDTIWVVFEFVPSATYNFSFSRSEPYVWQDSFRADYAITVDSQWLLFSADTVEVTVAPDPANPPVTVLDRVILNPSPSLDPPPDDTVTLDVLYGFWFDTARVIANPDDTLDFPPDSTYETMETWGYWYRLDSFFLAPDPAYWCDLDSMVIVAETLYDQFNFPSIVVDSLYYYGNCDAKIDSLQERIYNHYAWGVYPGGDENATPIPTFDTIIHFTFPDTTKKLFFDNGALSIDVPVDVVVIDSVTSDTTWQTLGASIEFIHENTSQNLTNMSIDLTMPPVEEFPQYDFIIREVPLKK